MKTEPTTAIVPESLKKAVNLYLLARATAELRRAEVDKIERQLLAEGQYRPSRKSVDRYRERDQVITDPKNSWKMEDSDHQTYLLGVRARLEAAGYRIEQTEGDPPYSFYCPACCAESKQRDAERLLILCAGDWLGIPEERADRLSRAGYGLDKRKEFLDLAVSLVVALPDFKKPELKGGE
jgi:hypothetical protein